MDRLPDPVIAERPAACPEHGAFLSRNIFGKVWSRCPTCAEAQNAQALAERQREEAKAAEARHRAMLDAACIPARFEGCTFESYVADTDGKLQAVTLARDYAENFADNAKRGASLIFAGKPGTGKSHLAGAILRATASSRVRYLTCLDMIRAIRDTWRRDSEKSESQLLTYLESLDLLVIDEVGMQYGTEGEQTILFDVLDRRYREVKPVVLLTNQDKAGFKAFVGERSYDRLTETARWVPFDWESHRPAARRAA